MAGDVMTLTVQQWQAFQAGLYERDDRLERREAGLMYPASETVDAYVLSAHAEALNSAEVDGDLWGTLEDLDETANTGEEAWAKITAFYLDRGCVLVRITEETEEEEPEEWLFTEDLARRLGLLGA